MPWQGGGVGFRCCRPRRRYRLRHCPLGAAHSAVGAGGALCGLVMGVGKNQDFVAKNYGGGAWDKVGLNGAALGGLR